MIGPSTGVPAAGWLLTTRTFVSVMFPVLLTTPPNTTELPAETGPGGQVSVMLMPGVETTAHVAETVVVSRMPVLASLPVAVRVSVAAQVSKAPLCSSRRS